MTAIKKHFLVLCLALVTILSLVFGATFIKSDLNAIVSAEVEANNKRYYYDHLTTTNSNGTKSEYTLAKKFYDVLENINEAGDFKKGKVSYELSDVITSNQIKSWVRDGVLDVPKAFSAARDSFLMDHPELFYVDLYKLTISASYSSGVYSAYVDTGREANVYRDKSFKNEISVHNAIVTFNNKVKQIANAATAAAEKDTTSVKDDLKLAKAVNEQIAKNVYYDFGTYNDATSEENVSVSNLTFSSYGAIVNNKAVCAGYSSAYKVVMDYLNIPCVMVSGYSKGKDQNGNNTKNDVGHSWNYVYLETTAKDNGAERTLAETAEKSGEWFAFDTTWNSLNGNSNRYSAMDSMTAGREYITDGVISSSGYELSYPALSSLSYNEAINPNTIADREIETFEFNFKSKHEYKVDSDTYDVFFQISYNGKNSTELLAQNMRMINRYQYMENGNLKWSRWQDITNSQPYDGSGIEDKEGYTSLYINNNVYQTQYAIIKDLTPDTDASTDYMTWKNIYFSDVEEVENHIVFLSQLYVNQVYGTYTAAPYVNNVKTSPYVGGMVIISDNMAQSASSAIMADRFATTFKVVYDEPLHILDNTKPINVISTPSIENAKEYSGFVAFSNGKYVHLVADENGVYNTLEFKFKPSLMYEHNRIGYAFNFTNVGSSKIVDKKVGDNFVSTTSDKLPNNAYFTFSRNYMACPKIFGDGRLWVDCCAQPVLADNSDLSEMNFQDEEGNSTFTESARSQMMLVVDKVSKEVENSMLNEIEDNNDININKADIKSSQTFDINLQICGKFPTIPDGSYVKIALGFPEGYGPSDEGVTFKLFHRKHIGGDNYIVEEIPCVVTKFGIVATVTSFSPYMVAVVNTNKVTDKTIYASIDGKGGKLSLEDGQIRTIEEGGSYEYTINPEDGYKLYNVSLNGENVTDKVKNGKLTVSYEELKHNNELTIQYIAEEVVESFEEKNIIEPVKVVVSTEGNSEIYDYNTDGYKTSNNNSVIIKTVSIVAAVAVLALVLTIVTVKKRKTTKQ